MSNKFYNLPPSWNPGYAIPEYVMAEPPGRGTFTTKWLPRGSISTLDPSFVADPGKRLLGRTDAGLGSLGDATVGGDSTLSGSSLGGGRVYNLEPFSDAPGETALMEALAKLGIFEKDILPSASALKRGDAAPAAEFLAGLTDKQLIGLNAAIGAYPGYANQKHLVVMRSMISKMLNQRGRQAPSGKPPAAGGGFSMPSTPVLVAGAAGVGLVAYLLLKRKGR